jgi:hypothetical protein
VVRVWESDPSEGEEALEWILLTSLSTATREHAWLRVEWYRCRWMVEEYIINASKPAAVWRSDTFSQPSG